jgi:hypothetical protein
MRHGTGHTGLDRRCWKGLVGAQTRIADRRIHYMGDNTIRHAFCVSTNYCVFRIYWVRVIAARTGDLLLDINVYDPVCPPSHKTEAPAANPSGAVPTYAACGYHVATYQARTYLVMRTLTWWRWRRWWGSRIRIWITDAINSNTRHNAR